MLSNFVGLLIVHFDSEFSFCNFLTVLFRPLKGLVFKDTENTPSVLYIKMDLNNQVIFSNLTAHWIEILHLVIKYYWTFHQITQNCLLGKNILKNNKTKKKPCFLFWWCSEQGSLFRVNFISILSEMFRDRSVFTQGRGEWRNLEKRQDIIFPGRGGIITFFPSIAEEKFIFMKKRMGAIKLFFRYAVDWKRKISVQNCMKLLHSLPWHKY